VIKRRDPSIYLCIGAAVCFGQFLANLILDFVGANVIAHWAVAAGLIVSAIVALRYHDDGVT
jgi:hypothetical protein